MLLKGRCYAIEEHSDIFQGYVFVWAFSLLTGKNTNKQKNKQAEKGKDNDDNAISQQHCTSPWTCNFVTTTSPLVLLGNTLKTRN